ncbi:MAG: Fic family protein [Candidatus Daviesbacteria bacterium]|nr:Fic family protein [Candidatus Daviesbacteria bacterium]
MNDTNLNVRQKQILSILKQQSSVARQGLAQQISAKKGISRITIIRDLNDLINDKLVKVEGKGKNTRYSLLETNPLLNYLDLDGYFFEEDRIIKKKFDISVFNHLNNLYSPGEIRLWEKSKKVFKEAQEKLDPSIYKRELERFVIELSWKSSQIEGNTYSLIETETLIKQNIKARGHSNEEAVMILNHRDAFNSIIKNKEDFKKIDFSDVVQLHNILTKGLITSGVRSQKVRISGTQYEPLSDKHELEKILRQLIGHVNKTEYPPEKALILAIMIAYLQPFADGNKRTSRMLSNAVLVAFDFPPLSYRNINVNEYRSVMIIFYETNNLFNFKRLYLKQLQYVIENYFQF